MLTNTKITGIKAAQEICRTDLSNPFQTAMTQQ